MPGAERVVDAALMCLTAGSIFDSLHRIPKQRQSQHGATLSNVNVIAEFALLNFRSAIKLLPAGWLDPIACHRIVFEGKDERPLQLLVRL